MPFDMEKLKTLDHRVKEAVNECLTSWYAYEQEGYDVTVTDIQPIIGTLYKVTIKLEMWITFDLQALYLDSEEGEPSLFLDSSVISNLIESPMFNHFKLRKVRLFRPFW